MRVHELFYDEHLLRRHNFIANPESYKSNLARQAGGVKREAVDSCLFGLVHECCQILAGGNALSDKQHLLANALPANVQLININTSTYFVAESIPPIPAYLMASGSLHAQV